MLGRLYISFEPLRKLLRQGKRQIEEVTALELQMGRKSREQLIDERYRIYFSLSLKFLPQQLAYQSIGLDYRDHCP